jgi:nucleotide-binding universal stress UspA family protein
MQTIIVTIDFTDTTQPAIAMGELMAKQFGSRLILLHVATAFDGSIPNVAAPVHEVEMVGHQQREDIEHMQRLATQIRSRGVATEAKIVEGRTIETILDEIREMRADLLIMGSHHHGRLYDMLIGTSTGAVVRKADIPVLIVPTTAAERIHAGATAGEAVS